MASSPLAQGTTASVPLEEKNLLVKVAGGEWISWEEAVKNGSEITEFNNPKSVVAKLRQLEEGGLWEQNSLDSLKESTHPNYLNLISALEANAFIRMIALKEDSNFSQNPEKDVIKRHAYSALIAFRAMYSIPYSIAEKATKNISYDLAMDDLIAEENFRYQKWLNLKNSPELYLGSWEKVKNSKIKIGDYYLSCAKRSGHVAANTSSWCNVQSALWFSVNMSRSDNVWVGAINAAGDVYREAGKGLVDSASEASKREIESLGDKVGFADLGLYSFRAAEKNVRLQFLFKEYLQESLLANAYDEAFNKTQNVDELLHFTSFKAWETHQKNTFDDKIKGLDHKNLSPVLNYMSKMARMLDDGK